MYPCVFVCCVCVCVCVCVSALVMNYNFHAKLQSAMIQFADSCSSNCDNS